MPIPNVCLSPTSFEALQNNITAQQAQFGIASNIALSGLNLIAQLNDVDPTADLIPGFVAHYTNLSQFDSVSNFTAVITALNSHIVFRGTTQQPGDNNHTRFNRWLTGAERLNEVNLAPVTVTPEYALLSLNAGYLVDPGNIL